MKLQEVTANIRLRSPWEAIDLGFAMVQAWAKSIYIPLAIITFSIATLLYLVVPKDNFWVAGLIFWWLKPLYDRLILHIISHKLFNNELTSWEALKALPSLIWNTGFFQSMTFRRFSFSRGFNLPIWQLEQLRGEPRASRQRILHLASHSQAVWLTIALAHLEIFLVLSLFMFLVLLMPEHIQSEFFDGIFNKRIEYNFWIDILNYAFYVVVVTVVHPFYIAANFALYINRRTQLESWDLELDFRKLGERLKNLALVIVASIIIGVVASPTPSFADEAPKLVSNTADIDKTEFLAKTRQKAELSKTVIEEVMLTENLDDKEKVMRWVKKETDKKKKKKKDDTDDSWIKELLKPIASFIGMIIEYSLWIAIAIGLLLLFYFRERWMHLFQGGKTEKDEYQSPDIMFGMDVRPESLPQDIPNEAQKLWQAGKHREALSLLYRGALVHLINEEKVQLEDSNTEGDVLRLSTKQLSETKLAYFKSLTAQWKLIAYAHRAPANTDMQHLFDHWSSDFKVPSAAKGGAPE